MNELTITDEKLDLIKRTVAKGTSNEELDLFLYTCKRTGLDPLTKQIYCIKRGGQMTIQTGIDGYRAIADRTGKYAGNDDPVFDNESKPRKATVSVYKFVEGIRCPFTSTARWDQYYPGHGKSPLWDKMPHLMLGKCAEALALRKAFPRDLSGLYTKEEMDQAEGPAPTFSRQYALKPEPEVKELPRDGFVEKLLAPEEAEPPPWDGKIKEVSEHRDPKGKADWVLYRVTMEDERSATTFKPELADDARIMIGTKVRVLVEDNKRKPGTFTYLGFEEIPEPQAKELFPTEKEEEQPW